MKVRVLYREDGGVSVVHPAPKSRRKDEPEEQWLDRVFVKSTPEGIEYDDVDKSTLPQNRDDRDAWEGSKGIGVIVNWEKADALRLVKVNDAAIKTKEKEILRRQAIAELEAEKIK